MRIPSYFRSKFRHGFTLIELLLVIGIIAILASIVIVAINPTKQLGDARDAQRRSDVNSILNAVYQYAIDNNGSLPTDISSSTEEICAGVNLSCGAGNVNLRILTGAYLVDIPNDPQFTSGTGTAYYIFKDARGRVTVSAPLTEQAATDIEVTR